MIIYFNDSSKSFVFEYSIDGYKHEILCGVNQAREISKYLIEKLEYSENELRDGSTPRNTFPIEVPSKRQRVLSRRFQERI